MSSHRRRTLGGGERRRKSTLSPTDFSGNDFELNPSEISKYFTYGSNRTNASDLLRQVDEAAFENLREQWGDQLLNCAQFIDLLSPMLLASSRKAQQQLQSSSSSFQLMKEEAASRCDLLVGRNDESCASFRRRRESNVSIAQFLRDDEMGLTSLHMSGEENAPSCGGSKRNVPGASTAPIVADDFQQFSQIFASVSFQISTADDDDRRGDESALGMSGTFSKGEQSWRFSGALTSEREVRDYLRVVYVLIDKHRTNSLSWDSLSSFLVSGITGIGTDPVVSNTKKMAKSNKEGTQKTAVTSGHEESSNSDRKLTRSGGGDEDDDDEGAGISEAPSHAGAQQQLECIVRYQFAGEVIVPKLDIGNVSKEWFHTLACCRDVIGGKTMMIASSTTVSFFSCGTWRREPPPAATLGMALLSKESSGGSEGEVSKGSGTGSSSSMQKLLMMRAALEQHTIRHETQKAILAVGFIGEPYYCVVTSTPHFECPFVVWQYSTYLRRPPQAIVDGRLYPATLCDATVTALLWVRSSNFIDEKVHGGTLWVGTRVGTVISIATSIDPETEAVRFGKAKVVARHADTVTTFLHLPQRDVMVTASFDTTVRIIPKSGRHIILRAHTRSVSALEFSRRNLMLYTAGHDGVIVAWAENQWTSPAYLLEDTGREKIPIVSVKAIPSTPFVASFDVAGTLKIFDTVNQAVIRCIHAADPIHIERGLIKSEHLRSAQPVAGTNSDASKGGGSQSSHQKQGKSHHGLGSAVLAGHYFACMEFTDGTDRDLIVAGSRIYRFSLSDKAVVNATKAHNTNDVLLNVLNVTQHGFATVSNKELSIWSLRNGMKSVSFSHFSATTPISCVAVHLTSDVMMVGNDEGVIVAYQMSTGAVVKVLECHDQAVSSMTLDPKSPLMVSTCRGVDSIIAVWEDDTLFGHFATGDLTEQRKSMEKNHHNNRRGTVTSDVDREILSDTLRVMPRQIISMSESAAISQFDPTGNLLAVASQTQICFFVKHIAYRRLVRVSRLDVGAISEIQCISWLPPPDAHIAKEHPAQYTYRLLCADNRGRFSLWEIEPDFANFTATHSLVLFWMNHNVIDEFYAKRMASLEELSKAAASGKKHVIIGLPSINAAKTSAAAGEEGEDEGGMTVDDVMDLAYDDAVAQKNKRLQNLTNRIGVVMTNLVKTPLEAYKEQLSELEQEARRRERLRLEELSLVVSGDPQAQAEYKALLAQLERDSEAAITNTSSSSTNSVVNVLQHRMSNKRQARERRLTRHGLFSMQNLKQRALVQAAETMRSTDPQLTGAIEMYQSARAKRRQKKKMHDDEKLQAEAVVGAATAAAARGLEERMLSANVRCLALDVLYPFLLYTGDESGKVSIWYLATEDPNLDRAALRKASLILDHRDEGRDLSSPAAEEDSDMTHLALMCWLEEPQALHSFLPFAAKDDDEASLTVAVTHLTSASTPFHCLVVGSADNRVYLTSWDGILFGKFEQGPILHREWKLRTAMAQYNLRSSFSTIFLWMKLRRFVLGGFFRDLLTLRKKEPEEIAIGRRVRHSYTFLRDTPLHLKSPKPTFINCTSNVSSSSSRPNHSYHHSSAQPSDLQSYVSPFSRREMVAGRSSAFDIDENRSSSDSDETGLEEDDEARQRNSNNVASVASTTMGSIATNGFGRHVRSGIRPRGGPVKARLPRCLVPLNHDTSSSPQKGLQTSTATIGRAKSVEPPTHQPTNISILAREELRECFHSPKPHPMSALEMIKRPQSELDELVQPTIKVDVLRKPAGLPPLMDYQKSPASSNTTTPAKPQQHKGTTGSPAQAPTGHSARKKTTDSNVTDNDDDDDNPSEDDDFDDVRERPRAFDDPPFVTQRRAVFGNKAKLASQLIARPLPDNDMARRVIFATKAEVSSRAEAPIARKRALLLY